MQRTKRSMVVVSVLISMVAVAALMLVLGGSALAQPQWAQIIVFKYEDMDADGAFDGGEPGLQGWDFVIYDSPTGTQVSTGSTGINGKHTWNNIPPGKAYSVCEQLPAGWFNSQPSDPDVAGPGEVCVNTGVLDSGATTGEINFGNYQWAQIIVHKYRDVDGDANFDAGEPALQGWDFVIYDSPAGTQVATGSTGLNGKHTWNNMSPGKAYSVCEQLPAGWFNSQPSDPDVAGPGEVCVNTGVLYSGGTTGQIDFGNYTLGHITLYKGTDPPAYDQDFYFDADPLPDFTLNAAGTDRATFTDLVSGTYSFTEMVPPGWANYALSCVSSWADVSLDLANANITIDLLWGGEVTCTFENRAPGHITIVKEVEWMPPAGDWEFSSDMGDFTIPAAGGQQDFPNLLSLEDYTIAETLKDGYDTMVVCDTGESGTDSVTVSLDPAEEVVCIFTNRTPPIGVVVDELGNRKDEFSVMDDVYAYGVGFEPNSQVDVYIVGDAAWTDGDPIPPDVSGDGMNTVPVDAAGHLGPVLVWPAPLMPGEYDMVFDANQNGTFDFWFDAVDDPNHPGFIVLARIPVGGTTNPVSNLTLLAPWLGLAALVMVGAATVVWRRAAKTA